MTDNNAVVAATSTKIIFNTLNEETRTVSARELHDRLGVATDFSHWRSRLVNDCQFSTENGDFLLVRQKCPTNNPKNPWTEITDYDITFDVAKEACMLCRNDTGKMFRRYFIEVEKEWNNSPMMQIIRQSKSPYETSLALAELFKKEKEEKTLLIEQRDKAEEAKAIAEQERDDVKEAFSRSVVSDNDKLYSTFIKELKMTNPCASSLLKELKIFGKTGHLSDYGDWFKIKVSDNGFPARFVTKLGQEMLIKLFNNNRDKMRAINGTYRYIKPQDRFKVIP